MLTILIAGGTISMMCHAWEPRTPVPTNAIEFDAPHAGRMESALQDRGAVTINRADGLIAIPRGTEVVLFWIDKTEGTICSAGSVARELFDDARRAAERNSF